MPGAGHEGAEEGELAGGEVEDAAGADRAAGGGIEFDVAEAEGGFCARAWSADHGSDAGEQLGEAEGLRDVVVGAAVESFDAVGDGVARGNDDHGDVGAGLSELADEGEAVEAGQVDVEEDEVVVAGAREVEAGGAVRGDLDGITFLRQSLLQRGCHAGSVFDDEHVHVPQYTAADGTADERRY
jgi:hypothetical protein